MRKLIEFFIGRSLIVNLLTVMIILVGLVSVISLQKETFPPIDFDVVLVTTIYPGSSAEDVERLVTIPIERAVKGVNGIDELNGISKENLSVLWIQVDADSEMDEVLDDVKSAVDTINDFPEDVEVPVVTKIDNTRRGVLNIALTGGEYTSLRDASLALRDKLEQIPAVAIVEFGGYKKDEIRIEVDPVKLNSYELTIGEVANAVRSRNLNLSAGKIESDRGDIIVRTVAEFKTPEEIAEVVIRSNTSGRRVKIKDVATVSREPLEDTILQRSQGQRAIFLRMKIKPNADIIRSTNRIKNTTKNFFAGGQYPEVKHRYSDDLSYYVKRRLNVLKNNGLLGMGLVFMCLMFFLNFRTSFITSPGAPIAFMTAFFCMDMFGLSINLISMFGLILVLGMLVDDAIIVAEQFYQKLEGGMPPKQAAKEAAIETIKPVTATILTTMIAFGSLFFMGGIMGKFLWSVPAVVMICLTASLFECFFILPSHLADFCKISKKTTKRRWYQPLMDLYDGTLKIALRHPLKIFFLFIFVFIGSLVLAKNMKFELFPGDDIRIAFIQLKGPVGTPLRETNAAMKKLENIALESIRPEEMDQVRTLVGQQRGSHGNKTGAHYGSLTVYLTDPAERERSTDEIINSITEPAKELIKGYSIGVTKVQGGPPKGKPVDIEIMGDDLEEIKLIANKAKEELLKIDGVVSSELDFEEGKKQLEVKVDDEEARRLGLTTSQIALELRRALSGDAITEIRESEEDIDIKILLDDVARTKVESLSLLHVLNNQGRRIPISRVVKLEEKPGAFVIRRLDRKRIISVEGSLDKEKTTPREIVKKMKPIMIELVKDHPKVAFEFGGENEDTKESMQRLLKSGMIALCCIFFVLVIMFSSLAQPIVIMMAIPLGLTGVIFTFFAFGKALGFMALMGVVGLIGVVVNDSIVLVNFINKKRHTVHEILEAIHQAALSRFRPVILTTFTTVAGLMPIAHSTGGDPFLKPMALAFAWGLLLSTFVTLVFIPINYLLYYRTLNLFRRIGFKLFKLNVKGGEAPTV